MRLCFMVFAMFSTIYYNIARKRDATASDTGQQIHVAHIVTVQAGRSPGWAAA